MQFVANLTFDQLPNAVAELNRKVDVLTDLLSQYAHQPPQSKPDRWLSIKELSDYLPGNPAIPTLYGKVQRREIPFIRNGKRLVFCQSEIDAWLHSQRVKTSTEINAVAQTFIDSESSRKGGRKAI